MTVLSEMAFFLNLILVCAICLLRLQLVATKSYSPTDIPNPMLSVENAVFCGRPGVDRSAICDPENIISKSSKDVIEGFINKATTSQIGVVVISSMAKSFIRLQSIETASEKFARTIHDTWQVGDKFTNNGVLVFLSIEDRAFFVSTGVGVSNALTVEHIHSILEHAKSKLRMNAIGPAVEGIIVEIDMIISSPAEYKKQSFEHRTVSDSVSNDSDSLSLLLVAAFVLLAGGFGFYQSRQKTELERGKLALDKLITEVKHMETDNKFKCSSCPICLEDFPVSITEAESDQHLLANANKCNTSSNDGEDIESATSTDDEKQDLLRRIDRLAPEPIHSSTLYTPPGNASKDKESSDKRRPMSLQCGHLFCYECISSHLKSGNAGASKCPICREPIDPNAPRSPPPPPPAPGQGPSPGHPGSSSVGLGSDGYSQYNDTDHHPSNADNFSNPSCKSSSASSSSSAAATGINENISTNNYASYSSMPASSASSASSSTFSSSSSSYLFRRNSPEILFRLNRMRYLYPNVMTPQSYGAMHAAIDANSIHEFTAAAQNRVIAVSQVLTQMREAAQRSGSSGASRGSFGGGRSSGGGGGRW